MKPGAFADLRRSQLRIGASTLDSTSKHVALQMLLLADEHGVGEPGRNVLAEMCSVKPKSVTRVKQRLNGPASPLVVTWEEDRRKADDSRMTDRYRLAWRGGYGTLSPLGGTGRSVSYPQKSRRTVGDLKSLTDTESPLIKELGVAKAPIREKQKRRTDGLTPTVAKDEQVGVAAFAPDAVHEAIASDLQLDLTEALAAFEAHHDNKGTALTPAKWSTAFSGWLRNRPARLAALAQREAAQVVREAKPKWGARPPATATTPPALTICTVNPDLWQSVLASLPAGVPVTEVLRLMHDTPPVALAVARALGVRDEVSQAASFRYDAGHDLAVTDYIKQQPQQHHVTA